MQLLKRKEEKDVLPQRNLLLNLLAAFVHQHNSPKKIRKQELFEEEK